MAKKKVITAEELVSKRYNVEHFNDVALYGSNLKEIMIEFKRNYD
jgi:hypothetical protein